MKTSYFVILYAKNEPTMASRLLSWLSALCVILLRVCVFQSMRSSSEKLDDRLFVKDYETFFPMFFSLLITMAKQL